MLSARPGALLRLLLALPLGLLPWFCTAPPGFAAIQADSASVAVTAIDASKFPDMQVSLAVRGAQGENVTALPVSAFALAENGSEVPALSMSEVEVGIQVALVVAADEAFLKRDATGTARLDYVKQSIGDFLVDHPWMHDGMDDISIFTPEGPLVMHGSTGG